MEEKTGYIYILYNPSLEGWVKIGYADNVEKRVQQLNSHETTPYAFRIYATYETHERLQDKSLHKLIDQLDSTLRSKEVINGKTRVREFYLMAPEDAFKILGMIANISGTRERLKMWPQSEEEKKEQNNADEVKQLALNRHHFIDCEFTSCGKKYKGTTNEQGTLKIIDLDNGVEIPNNSRPSKKHIIGVALEELGEEVDKDDTLYQRYHRLSKLINEQ